MIYLDCNATTPVDPEVAAAISACLGEVYGNPSSSHAVGRRARAELDRARAAVARLLGCRAGEVCFTSGGTESNNLAIMGTALRHGRGHIITSAIEHPSVMNTVGHLVKLGFEATYVGVDGQCRVSVDEVESSIRDDTVLITIMHSNNETGTLQPIDEIGSVARRRGIAFHTDAAQSVGKVGVSVSSVDMLSIAAHKFYGPKGVGALYIREGREPAPVMFGAAHERGLRPGTENVAGIAGLAKACEIAGRDLSERVGRANRLREMLLEGLMDGIGGLRLNGHPELTLPGTLNVSMPGIDASALVGSLSERLAVSTGSACHEGGVEPSAVLKAMGLSDAEALSSLRISIGKDNTEEEIRAASAILSGSFRQMARGR